MTVDYHERIEKGRFDRVTVIDENGEEVEVFNWITVNLTDRVRGYNPVYERFGDGIEIGAGDSMMDPDAVTKDIAEELQDSLGIDVRDHGIRVIDPTAEGVDVV